LNCLIPKKPQLRLPTNTTFIPEGNRRESPRRILYLFSWVTNKTPFGDLIPTPKSMGGGRRVANRVIRVHCRPPFGVLLFHHFHQPPLAKRSLNPSSTPPDRELSPQVSQPAVAYCHANVPRISLVRQSTSRRPSRLGRTVRLVPYPRAPHVRPTDFFQFSLRHRFSLVDILRTILKAVMKKVWGRNRTYEKSQFGVALPCLSNLSIGPAAVWGDTKLQCGDEVC